MIRKAGSVSWLSFYDVPAEDRDQRRSANPTESAFATVRHRTERTRGALSQDTARLMVFKPVMTAAPIWRRLTGKNQVPRLVQGVGFQTGVEVTDAPFQDRGLIPPPPGFRHGSGTDFPRRN